MRNIANGTNFYETWGTWKAGSFDVMDVGWEASIRKSGICEAGLEKLGGYVGGKVGKVSIGGWRKGVGGCDPSGAFTEPILGVNQYEWRAKPLRGSLLDRRMDGDIVR